MVRPAAHAIIRTAAQRTERPLVHRVEAALVKQQQCVRPETLCKVGKRSAGAKVTFMPALPSSAKRYWQKACGGFCRLERVLIMLGLYV